MNGISILDNFVFTFFVLLIPPIVGGLLGYYLEEWYKSRKSPTTEIEK